MLDKAVERQRSRAVAGRLSAALADLGFSKDAGASCVRQLRGATCRVGLQKFRHQPAFRVVMSFAAPGQARPVVEFSDRWTYRDSPAGRRFDFGIRWGEDAAERCLREIREFVELVALPWFEARAVAAGNE
jgi:hypothetical protein